MAAADRPTSAQTEAHQVADALARALEEAGFDVGREFPALSGMVDNQGASLVALGDVSKTTAYRLSAILFCAARLGVAVADE